MGYSRIWRVGLVCGLLYMVTTALGVPHWDLADYQEDGIESKMPFLQLRVPSHIPKSWLHKLVLQLIAEHEDKGQYDSPENPGWATKYRYDTPVLTSDRDRIIKRVAPETGASEIALFHARRLQKIKKGKGLRPQMVCYFKLCAFRSPNK